MLKRCTQGPQCPSRYTHPTDEVGRGARRDLLPPQCPLKFKTCWLHCNPSMAGYNGTSVRQVGIMKRIIALAALMVLFSWQQSAADSTGLTAGVGYGSGESAAYYLTLKHAFGSVAQSDMGYLTPTLELSGHVWTKSDDRTYGLTLAPGLRYDFLAGDFFHPYIGYTLGATVISDEELGRRDFGSHVLMLNRGLVGVRFGESIQQRLEFNYSYYSTLGLTSTDDGFGVWGVNYGLDF